MSETYEQLRDGAEGEGGEAWRKADREEGKLRALYSSLKEDGRFTGEHKAEQAWNAYEAARAEITENRAKARELLAKRATSAEEASLPLPTGEWPITTDVNKLLASQNEAARIARKLDRMEASNKGPFKPNRMAVLRREYGRGLEVGGVQGGAICRGVLSAADEFAIDRESVVDGFRKDRHREALVRAEHCARLARNIGGRVPEPPFPRPGACVGSDFHTRSRTPAFLAQDLSENTGGRSGRKPPWK